METVWIQRPGWDTPWGFRLTGGAEQQKPLTVQRVTPGSVADKVIAVGDQILKVGSADTSRLSQSHAHEYIKNSGNLLQLTIRRASDVTPASPQSSQYSSPYSNQPYTSPYSAQNTSPYSADPMSFYSPQYSGQPTSQYGGQPTSQYSGQPTSQYGGQPTSQYTGQPTSPYSAQPSPYYPSQSYSAPMQQPQQQTSSPYSNPTSHYSPPVQQQQPASAFSSPYASARTPARSPYETPRQQQSSAPSQQQGGTVIPIQVQRQQSHPSEQQPGVSDFTGGSAYPQQQTYGRQPSYEAQPAPYAPRQPSLEEREQAYSPPKPKPKPPSPMDPSQQSIPDALHAAFMRKGDKKPFSYTPTGLDLSHVKKDRKKTFQSPSLQRCLIEANYTAKSEPAKPSPPVPEGPGAGEYAHAQYNSPLSVYSAENAEDAFIAQSGGIVTGVEGLQQQQQSKKDKDITDSKTYKLIHGIDQPKPNPSARAQFAFDRAAGKGGAGGDEPEGFFKNTPSNKQSRSFKVLQWMTDSAGADEPDNAPPEAVPASQKKQLSRHNSTDDEMRFSGLHGKADIPSRSFQALQQRTQEEPQPQNMLSPTPDQNAVKQNGVSPQPRRIVVKRSPSLSRSDQSSPKPEETGETLEHVRSKLSHVEIKREQPDSEDDRASGTNENVPWQVPTRLPGQSDDESVGNYNEASIRYQGKKIPGKSFKMLQAMTGADDTVQPKQRSSRASSEDEGSVGNYDETSIRYKGRNTPGKTFKKLQSLTGSEGYVPPPARRISLTRKEEPEGDTPDGPKEVRYGGSHIPSKSFQALQMALGDEPTNTETAPPSNEAVHATTPPRTVKVIQVSKQPNGQQASDGSAHASEAEAETEDGKRPIGIVGEQPLLPMSVARAKGDGETEF